MWNQGCEKVTSIIASPMFVSFVLFRWTPHAYTTGCRLIDKQYFQHNLAINLSIATDKNINLIIASDRIYKLWQRLWCFA